MEAVYMFKYAAALENSLAALLKRELLLKIELNGHTTPLLGIYPRKMKTYVPTKACTQCS